MANEEAIKRLKVLTDYEYDKDLEALNMAIEALEKEAVLGKIRAEIEQITDTMGVSYNQYVSKIDVLQIIDKYKAETKIEQGLNFGDQDTMMPAT